MVCDSVKLMSRAASQIIVSISNGICVILDINIRNILLPLSAIQLVEHHLRGGVLGNLLAGPCRCHLVSLRHSQHTLHKKIISQES